MSLVEAGYWVIFTFSYVLFYTSQIFNNEQVLLLQFFFFKGNNQGYVLKIHTDILRLMTPSWLGAECVTPHPTVSCAPRKVFISQPWPV